MFNCFKKYSVAFLFLYISSANAMMKKITESLPEILFGYYYNKQIKLDSEFWKAIRASIYSEQDFRQIEECLNKGANLNAKSNKETPLTWSIIKLNTNLMKFFIQHDADVNLKSTCWAPLAYSIYYQEKSMVKILCDSGASLVNLINFYPGANAFHYAVEFGGGDTKEIIQTLITHARFDSYDKNQEEKERKILAVLSVLSQFHRDIRFRILEELILLDDDYSSNKKLNKKLLSLGYTRPIFVHINKRVKGLIEILDSEDDRYEQTPSEWVTTFNHALPNQDKKEIRALLNKKKLQKNWDNFNTGFPDILKSESDNPICEMYNKIVLDLK